VSVQPLSTNLKAGQNASYAVWVWLVGRQTGTATVTVTASPGKLAPAFTVCPVPGKATCPVGLSTVQPVELQASLAVPVSDAGVRITLTANGTSPQAASTAHATGSLLVAAQPAAAGTSSAAPGVGVTLPAGPLAGVGVGTLPSSGSLPQLPDPATPALTFPKVSPEPSPAAQARPIRVTDVSASFPLDPRLIGGQVVGLAVLAAAVTIAVARLSFRRPKPQHSKDADAS
jgi:hypothetical protein